MNRLEASALIDAPIASVWRLLTSGAEIARWDSGFFRIEGQIAVGHKIRVFSDLEPKRGMTARVVTLDKEDRMVWRRTMRLGLVVGTRTFVVREKELKTDFYMHEELSGPLSRVLAPSVAELGPSFRRFAQGLKKRAEKDAMVR